MDSAEFTEWRAFERLEPFSELQGDLRAGQVVAMLHNIHRKPNSDPLTAADFFPALDYGRAKPEPVLLDDPKAQADLIRRAVFGVRDDG